MTPYQCYCEYVGIKRHFEDWRYDYERFGPAKIKPETYDKRPDAFRFQALARRPNPRWAVASVLARRDGAWVMDVLSDDGKDVAAESLGRVESMTYTIQRELRGRDPRALLESSSDSYPLLAREVMGGRISHEVGSLIVGALDLTPRWRRLYDGDPIMESLTRRLSKYHLFLPVDRKKAVKTIVQVLRDSV